MAKRKKTLEREFALAKACVLARKQKRARTKREKARISMDIGELFIRFGMAPAEVAVYALEHGFSPVTRPSRRRKTKRKK